MMDEEEKSHESKETGNFERSDEVLSKEDSLREKLVRIVQIDDSELPQSIKDQFREG